MITPKEQKLLNFIQNYQMGHGASPTVREMREHMKLKSDGFVVHCIKSLVTKGMIKKGDTPRSIKLLPIVQQRLEANFVKLPLLGTIPAGGPVLTEEYVEDWMTFDASVVKHPEDCFVLKVRGDSMIDAGIFEGDYVIASSTAKPKHGDIVVALIDGGSTVKRYVLERGTPYLKPENKKYHNIYPESELEVQGVVRSLFRWY